MGLKLGHRIIIVCLSVLLLFTLSSCKPTYETREFNTLGELMEKLGSELLYPNKLPEGFFPETSSFIGYRYYDSDTWEYNISFFGGDYEEELYGRAAFEPDRFIIGGINIRNYEPVHTAPSNPADYRLSSEYMIARYEGLLLDVDPSFLLEIEGVQVMYGPNNPSGITSEEDGITYMYTRPSARFRSDGVLYVISIALYSNETGDYEKLIEYGRELTLFMVSTLLT